MHQSQPLRLYPTGGHFAAKCGGHFKTENGGQLQTKSWGSITHEKGGSIWTEYPASGLVLNETSCTVCADTIVVISRKTAKAKILFMACMFKG